MNYLLLTIFFSCFAFITWQRFYLGLSILFFLLPTYLIRFNIGLLPTNMLEVMLGIVALFWLFNFKNELWQQIKKIAKDYKYLFIGYTVFVIAATISIFTSSDTISAAGKWKAFYVEPFVLFLILATAIKNSKQLNKILVALVGSGIATGILALYQSQTGWMVPYSFWENNQTYRVTGWYGFPNGVGHYLAPIVPIAIYLVKKYYNQIISTKNKLHNTLIANKKIVLKLFFVSLFLPLAILGAVFAKSSAAIVGIAGAIGTFILYKKKIRWWAIGIGTMLFTGLLLLPSNNPIKQELFMQNRSGQIRIDMWKETIQYISDNPIFGAGIGNYKNEIIPYRTTAKIEVFHHPHNLILTMWVNLGILGVIGFLWILIWFFMESIYNTNYKKQQEVELSTLAVTTLAVFVIMGLVDSPYIKNDLALFFWLPIAITVLRKKLATS